MHATEVVRALPELQGRLVTLVGFEVYLDDENLLEMKPRVPVRTDNDWLSFVRARTVRQAYRMWFMQYWRERRVGVWRYIAHFLSLIMRDERYALRRLYQEWKELAKPELMFTPATLEEFMQLER